MVRALIGAVIVGVMCPLVGAYVVTRNLAFLVRRRGLDLARRQRFLGVSIAVRSHVGPGAPGESQSFAMTGSSSPGWPWP